MARANWHPQLAEVPPEHLVFLDESGVQTNMTRLRGRAPVGERLKFKAPRGHWQTTTIVAAVRLTGPCAPAVFDGPIDRPCFQAYLEQVLVKSLARGDVVVMDNLSVHKGPEVAAALEKVGARVLYLPSYSPDYNPIENMWSKVKAIVRALEARTFETLITAVAHAIERVTRADCLGFFHNCQYAISLVEPL